MPTRMRIVPCSVPTDGWLDNLPNCFEVLDMKMLHPDTPWIGDEEVHEDELVIATTRDELVLLASSIGEALEAVEEWEFGTRLGAGPDEARVLRDRINDALRAAFRPA
jgi:hypothetical protein